MLFVEEWVDVVESLTDCFLRCPCLFQGVESWVRDLARAPRLGEGGLNFLCFVHILTVIDLDKAAEVEEERKMQEAAMLLKHQETPGGSFGQVRFLRTCPRYLGRRLHQPLLQGRGEPVRADRRREQVRPAQHEGQPAQGDQDQLSFKCIFFLTRS